MQKCVNCNISKTSRYPRSYRVVLSSHLNLICIALHFCWLVWLIYWLLTHWTYTSFFNIQCWSNVSKKKQLHVYGQWFMSESRYVTNCRPLTKTARSGQKVCWKFSKLGNLTWTYSYMIPIYLHEEIGLEYMYTVKLSWTIVEAHTVDRLGVFDTDGASHSANQRYNVLSSSIGLTRFLRFCNVLSVTRVYILLIYR